MSTSCKIPILATQIRIQPRMTFNFKSLIPHLAALAIFALSAIVYFSPQFSGKVIPQGDIISYRGMSAELRKHQEETGEKTLWTNSMFGGMPTYQIQTISAGNYIKPLEKVARLGLKAPAGQIIAGMFGFYLLMVLLGVNSWLSIAGAIAFGFCTNNFVLYEAGHVTKLAAITYLPILTSGVLLAFRKQYLLGGLIFGIGSALDLGANHIQMTYYFFLTLLIYGVAQLITAIRTKTMAHFGKASAALLVGGLLAIGSTASNLYVTYEYAKDTMRGEPILERAANTEATSSSETDGLEYGYAMQWSNNTLDLFAGFIPGVAGGSLAEPTSRSSAYGKAMTRLGARLPAEFDAPLYWGALPFTSGPIYFGAVVVFLFVLGLFLVDGPIKWWVGLGALLTALLSLGDNFSTFNRLLFDYLPLFNKFRTPNSVLSVTAVLLPIVGILGLQRILDGDLPKKKVLRSLYISLGITGGIALFFALLGSSMFEFTSETDGARIARMLGGQGDQNTINSLINGLIDTRMELMQADSFRSLLLVIIAAGLIYGVVQQKIKWTIMSGGLIALILFDLASVNTRYVNKDDFQRLTSYQQLFAERPVDTQILRDPDPHYRVMDMTVSSFESAQPSYHHKTIGGYHAAKLQRYQDLIDRHMRPTQGAPTQAVFDMLNAKYFILLGQGGEPQAQKSPSAYGNAWLVDSIATAASNNAEIDALKTVPLNRAAVVHQEFSDYLNGLSLSGAGTISLTEYLPNRLTYQSSTDQDELAVFSEIWYGPDKGWQAYVDGEAVPHIRANYALRALKIPAGQHKIEFVFAPQTYKVGKAVSTISSLLLLLGLLGYLALQWRKNNA